MPVTYHDFRPTGERDANGWPILQCERCGAKHTTQLPPDELRIECGGPSLADRARAAFRLRPPAPLQFVGEPRTIEQQDVCLTICQGSHCAGPGKTYFRLDREDGPSCRQCGCSSEREAWYASLLRVGRCPEGKW